MPSYSLIAIVFFLLLFVSPSLSHWLPFLAPIWSFGVFRLPFSHPSCEFECDLFWITGYRKFIRTYYWILSGICIFYANTKHNWRTLHKNKFAIALNSRSKLIFTRSTQAKHYDFDHWKWKCRKRMVQCCCCSRHFLHHFFCVFIHWSVLANWNNQREIA